MRDIHLIVVGKLNDKNIIELENDYFKRITNPKLHIHEVKAHAENLNQEAKEVLGKLNELFKQEKPLIILLTEKGQQFTSVAFSLWLEEKNATQSLVFIIGGASGHGEAVIKAAHYKLSLSELTYPHKLARLLLVEQLYRAQTIRHKHPYNK